MTARTPAEVAAATASSVSKVGARFMSDPSLEETGRWLGYEGIDFYFAGRAGVLGQVGPEVAVAALVFFEPATVRAAWRRSEPVQSRLDAATAFAACASDWARTHLSGELDWDRLARLSGFLCERAPSALAPIFAGWRALPVPGEPRQAAVHQLYALREYRMACHAAALLAVGVDVGDAVRHRSPGFLDYFGWDPAIVPPVDVASRWAEAEGRTDDAVGRLYGTLEANELVDFADLVTRAAALAAEP